MFVIKLSGVREVSAILQVNRKHIKLKQITLSQLQIRCFFHPKRAIYFLFPQENICLGYSLEGPRRGTSSEYPQCMFSCINKKTILRIPLISGVMTLYYGFDSLSGVKVIVREKLSSILKGHDFC